MTMLSPTDEQRLAQQYVAFIHQLRSYCIGLHDHERNTGQYHDLLLASTQGIDEILRTTPIEGEARQLADRLRALGTQMEHDYRQTGRLNDKNIDDYSRTFATLIGKLSIDID